MSPFCKCKNSEEHSTTNQLPVNTWISGPVIFENSTITPSADPDVVYVAVTAVSPLVITTAWLLASKFKTQSIKLSSPLKLVGIQKHSANISSTSPSAQTPWEQSSKYKNIGNISVWFSIWTLINNICSAYTLVYASYG